MKGTFMSDTQPNYIGKYRNVTHVEIIMFPFLVLFTVGVWLPIWLLIFTNRKRSEIKVFSDCVEIETNFIRKRVNRIEASKIESVDFNEGIIGKSSYGTVRITGSGMKRLNLTPVLKPEELATKIRNIASAPISKSNSSSSESLVSSLENLRKLHSDGVLNDEEFEKAKNKLL